MVSLWLTRWFMGYVQFSLIGGIPERFLNQCARSGIYLWDIRGGKDCGACVAAGKYRELRCLARRAGSKLKLKKRYGLPFATMGIRKRRGMIAGAVLFAVIVSLLSMRVWYIDVVGNATIPTAEIKSELAELGIVPGSLKNSMNPQMLQQALMIKFPEVSWLSVNTRGCTAEVRLKEKAERPPMEVKDTRPCNIKAASTGQILFMEVYAGTAQVKEGDAVVEGQLLISGIVEDEKGFTSLKHAAGRIVAETSRTFTTEVELKRSVVQQTGQVVTQRSFNFLGARLPLSFIGKPTGNYRAEGVYTEIKLMNSVLPIGVFEENWIEEHTVNITITKEQARREAENQMKQKLEKELSGAKIASVNGSDTIVGSKLIYTETVKCEQNIAQESEILIK